MIWLPRPSGGSVSVIPGPYHASDSTRRLGVTVPGALDYAGHMATSASELLERIPHIPAKEAADRLGVEPSRIKQLIRERQILGLRVNGQRYVLDETLVELPPERQHVAELQRPSMKEPRIVRVTDEPLPALRGTALLLEDGGYSYEELVDWIWRDNPWLQGRPIDLLRSGAHKQVNKVAATEAW